MQPTNAQYKDEDLQAWQLYRKNRTGAQRAALLKRLDPLIQRQALKWAGPVPRDVLLGEARLLAAKSFDSYDPSRGAALATHVTNNLAPLSRVVYTHQNAARLPENIAIKVQSYNAAKEHLTTLSGREPTIDELHQELGWGVQELGRMEDYQRRDLVESVGNVSGAFHSTNEDEDGDLIDALYLSLAPDEKKLFEYVTGHNGTPVKSNPEIMKLLGLTQAQLSYKKTLLTNKLQTMMRGSHAR